MRTRRSLRWSCGQLLRLEIDAHIIPDGYRELAEECPQWGAETESGQQHEALLGVAKIWHRAVAHLERNWDIGVAG
jgi:hypothetical protein